MSPLTNSHYAPLSENMTSFTKPEVNKISQRRQSSTKLQPQVHRNLVKFGRVVFELWKQTDRQTERETDRETERQTDILITILHTHPGAKCGNHGPMAAEVTGDPVLTASIIRI